MIVVATEDFELYHAVVAELRERGVVFTTVEPDDALPERTRVVVAGDGENPLSDEADAIELVRGDPADPRKAVDAALSVVRDGGRTVIGVDPGERPGVAVLSGEIVVAAFQVPVGEAAAVIEREVTDAVDPIVKIGDGARLAGASLIEDLDIPVELVDETGTTPHLGTGARGMGDVLAAVNIARLEGERVAERRIEPTAGELGVIKARSRERSPENREINEVLARRVAAGELSIDEALAEHRNS